MLERQVIEVAALSGGGCSPHSRQEAEKGLDNILKVPPPLTQFTCDIDLGFFEFFNRHLPNLTLL